MASAKSILERMIAAMNRGETVRQRDIDVFATLTATLIHADDHTK